MKKAFRFVFSAMFLIATMLVTSSFSTVKKVDTSPHFSTTHVLPVILPENTSDLQIQAPAVNETCYTAAIDPSTEVLPVVMNTESPASDADPTASDTRLSKRRQDTRYCDNYRENKDNDICLANERPQYSKWRTQIQRK